MDESAIIADAINRSPTGALNDPNILKEDTPPMLRFERVALEDRHATIERGVYSHKDAHQVNIRSYGDNKTEVPYIVWTTMKVPTIEQVLVRKKTPTKVRLVNEDGTVREVEEIEERETMEDQTTFTDEDVFPWIDVLKDRLRNAFITQSYYDHCINQYEFWKEKGDVPLNGFPVVEWNMVSPAQQRTLVDAGINTGELVAEMTEDAMETVGFGSRELKKKAQAWMTANTDTAPQAAYIMRLEEAVETMQSSYEKKIDELHKQILEGQGIETAE